MSDIVNINNGLYEFKVYLVNSSAEGSIFPIFKSAIDYLEIEDSLAFPGLRGTISISNFFAILQKLEVFDLTTGNNVISIEIINKEAEASKSLPIKLSFEGLLSEAGETSANVIDKKLVMTFEELNVGLLRNRYITNENLSLNSKFSNLGFSLGTDSSSTATQYILQVISRGLNLEDLSDVFITPIEDTGIPAPVGSIVEKTQNCYEVLWFLLRNSYYEDGLPSLLQIKNVYENNDVKRKFSFTNQAKFISDFFNELKASEGQQNKDFSKYLLETFIVGSSNNTNTYSSNFIDRYDIIRPNFKEVLSKKWVNYGIAKSPNSFEGNSEFEFFPYLTAKAMFELKVLGGTYASTLPGKTTATVSGFNKEILVNEIDNEKIETPMIMVIPEIPEWSDATKARLMKSFIYDNIAITFRVPGNLYRESGYFIKIDLDPNEETKNKATDLSGYYYVISVKHIFKGENYQNEIIAVKLYKNETLTENLGYLPKQTTPPKFISASAPSTSVVGSGDVDVSSIDTSEPGFISDPDNPLLPSLAE